MVSSLVSRTLQILWSFHPSAYFWVLMMELQHWCLLSELYKLDHDFHPCWLPGTESALAINTGKMGWEVTLKLLSDISRQAVQTEILLRECKPTRGTCQHPSFFQGSPLGLQGSKRKCYLSTLPSSWGRKKAENSGWLGHIVKYQIRSCIEEGMNPWLPSTMKATWVTSLGRQTMAVRILWSK